jgi:O-methyltransferase
VSAGAAGLPPGVELYLDLMKRTLSFYLWGEPLREYRPPRGLRPRAVLARTLVRRLGRSGKRIYDTPEYDPATRREGRDHPLFAHTMIGLNRLDNLQQCVLEALRDDVPGDLIETGVWRGGATIFMKAILRAMGEERRVVWVADSFRGLPKPVPERYPADAGDRLHTLEHLAVSMETVRANFEAYGLLDGNVRFLKGWFKDTLPSAPIKSLAVMRLDGDLYESTMDALTALYDRLSPGGVVIVDDYGDIASCRGAVEDFRAARGIVEELAWADWSCVWWRKRRA